MLLALICCGLQGQTLTLDSRFQTVPEAVQMLAQRTGLKLRARRELKDDPIMLVVKNRPVDQVLDWLEEAEGAEWIKEKDTLVIQRTPGHLHKLLQAEQLERATAIRVALERQIPIQPQPASAEKQEWVRYQSVFRNLARGIIRSVDPRLYSNLAIGAKRVFSNRSHPWEQPLPASSGPLLKEFLGLATQVWQTMADPDVQRRIAISGATTMFMSEAQTGRAGDPPRSVTTWVSFKRSRGGYYVEFRGVDQLNRGLGWDSEELTILPQKLTPIEGQGKLKDKICEPKYSFETLADPVVQAALIQEVATKDPAECLQGPWFDLFRNAFSEFVVALPDPQVALGAGPGSVYDELLYIQQFCDVSLKEGVLFIKPRSLGDAIETRLDRSVFREFLASARQLPLLSLERCAGYAVKQRRNSWASDLESLFIKDAFGFHNEMRDFLLSGTGRAQLRFYGFLGEDQRRSLWNSDSVALANCPAGARAELQEWLTEDAGLHVGPMWQGRPSGSPALLPFGFPADGVIVPRIASKPAVLSDESSSPMCPAVLDASQLGTTLFMQREAGIWNDPHANMNVAQARLLPLTRQELTLGISLGPVWAPMYLMSYAADPAAKPVRYDQLPLTHFDALRQQYELMLKNRRVQSSLPPLVRQPPPQ